MLERKFNFDLSAFQRPAHCESVRPSQRCTRTSGSLDTSLHADGPDTAAPMRQSTRLRGKTVFKASYFLDEDKENCATSPNQMNATKVLAKEAVALGKNDVQRCASFGSSCRCALRCAVLCTCSCADADMVMNLQITVL